MFGVKVINYCTKFRYSTFLHFLTCAMKWCNLIPLKFKHSVSLGIVILASVCVFLVYNGVGGPSAFWKTVFES